MKRAETVKKLKLIRTNAREIMEKVDIPAIERSMHMVDMYCHLAQWQLGDFEEVVPEAETMPILKRENEVEKRKVVTKHRMKAKTRTAHKPKVKLKPKIKRKAKGKK